MMKTIFKSVLLLLILVSCNSESELVLPQNGAHPKNAASESSGKKTVGANARTVCDIVGNTPGAVNCLDEIRTYTVTSNLTNPAINWSVGAGDMIIIGSTTGVSVSVGFGPGFDGGVLRAELVGVGGTSPIKCDDELVISASRCTSAPATPGPIRFDTFGPGSQNAHFCTGTQANLLEISPVDCATDYVWSISPPSGAYLNDGDGIRTTITATQPGNYRVTVRAVNCNGSSGTRSIVLSTERCGAGGINF